MTHRLTRALMVLLTATTVGLLLSSAVALAVPVTDPATASAARAAVEQRLAQMRADLNRQMVDYATLCRTVAEAKDEISQNATQLADLDSELATKQAQLDARALLLYQSNGDHVIELLTAPSLQSFLARAEYILAMTELDSDLIKEVATERARVDRLRTYLKGREALLLAQQSKADEDRVRILAKIKANEQALKEVGLGTGGMFATTVNPAGASGKLPIAGQKEPAGGFNQSTVMSDAKFYAVNSMNAADIQAYLDTQKGPLKSFSAPDHTGVVKTAAVMIDEASKAWGLSPMVVLSTLQKEQGLLSETNPTQKDFDWAMGAGWTDSKIISKYRGFGNQVWWGTNHIAKLAKEWEPGMTQDIDGTVVTPTNHATWGFYRYTPHFEGTTSFWMIYWRHFGDPM